MRAQAGAIECDAVGVIARVDGIDLPGEKPGLRMPELRCDAGVDAQL